MNHIVDGAISFFLQSSELGLPHPLTRRRVLSELSPPPLWWGGGAHSHAGEGVGGPNSNEGTDTMVLWVPLWYLVRGMNELLLLIRQRLICLGDTLKVHKHENFFLTFLQKPKAYGPKGL
jgi:hypothetical protein